MKKYIETYIKIIEDKLDEYLNCSYPEKIWEAMKYSVSAGGKRLRPMLVLEANKICGGKMEEALPTACALEMLHTYSLIHDDLPCMDNDDFRRGKPTNHKVFGEAIAVLAGDGLLSVAPEIILTKTPKTVDKEILFRIMEEFYDAIGPNGMLGGQVVDIISENKKVDIPTFQYIHTHKTGKLFEFALRSGAIIAKADEKMLNILTEYAKIIGYAFQIADDILDEISTFEKLGKTPHKDANANKNTHPGLFGIENSKEELLALCTKAKNILQFNSIDSPLLVYIAQGLVDKVKGD
ncbi:MAG: polyprenyl synthetase family protein [bacterium]|nr:polyprenyl synthetase family protein [bacterium]